MSQLYHILGTKPYASIRAELSAVLEWGEGKPVDPDILLNQPGWTLHEYDFAAGEAVLLHPGRDIELFKAAFSYRRQHMSVGAPPEFLDGVFDLDSDDTRFVDLAAASWCQMIGEFLAARQTMPMTALRYDHLLAEPVQNLNRIFAVCQLSPALAERAQAAFARDSHEGELSSRSRPVEKFTAEDNARILEILANPKFRLDPEIEL